MSSSLQNTYSSLVKDNEIEDYPTEYVETVKTCDKEKQGSKVWRAILILCKIGSKENGAISYWVTFVNTVNKMLPFPRLTAKESDTTKNGP